jgi:tetratricopeptide (TPR) repeat protein
MALTASSCCQAADLALKLGRAQDALALCQHVLAVHRWYLPAQLFFAQAHLEQGDRDEAARRFRLVLGVDPECAEAHSGMAVIAQAEEDAAAAAAAAARHLARAFENAPESDELRATLQQLLARQAGRPVPPPAFTPACVGRFYLRRGLPQPAAEAYAAAHQSAPDRDDIRLAYATALWQSGVRTQAADLCRPLLERTPRPLVALLLVAAEELLQRKLDSGRRLWNEARAWDPDDARAIALFGTAPGLPAAPRPAQVPPLRDPALAELVETAATLAAAAAPPESTATNELSAYVASIAGRKAAAGPRTPTDPDLQRFQVTVQEIEQRLFGSNAPSPQPAARAGQQPAEVLLAWEEGLRRHFGPDGLARSAELLEELAQSAGRAGVSSRVVYLDRSPYPELPAPDPRDPQAIKTFLDGLDRRLGEEGLDLHYLTLVGGEELLPLAPLPNPTEDDDETVPSDNLYASRDPTYLIPERAVGRLLDEGAGQVGPFLEQLGRCAARRRGDMNPASTSGCLTSLLTWMERFLPLAQPKALPQHRFGLSAQVWAQASQRVFDILPGQEPLHLCPPDCRDRLPSDWLADIPLAYFNLHGAADSPNWYGQRDMGAPDGGPLMPVAFVPDKIPPGRVAGIVVYSAGKDHTSSIAQRFIAEGALGMVGSTVISYGVSAPPLTDADLLGLLFWRALLQGQRLGDALLQAKVGFTQEIYRRQGYLDGDDMKTLLEFVLYGDPLVYLPAVPGASPHRVPELEENFPLPPVLCGRHAKSVAVHQLSGDLVSRVRRSLSWLQQGEAVESLDVALRSGCRGGACTGRCHQGKGGPEAAPEALVFTAHRELRTEDGTVLPQVARVVVDPRGRIVKMAVTR